MSININWTPDRPATGLIEELSRIRTKLTDESGDDNDWQNWWNANSLDLPSNSRIHDLSGRYPVWAIDDEGNCVVGEGDLVIEPIDFVD